VPAVLGFYMVLHTRTCTYIQQVGLVMTYGWTVTNDINDIIYNKPTRYNSDSIVFIKNYKYALHVSDALCVRLHEYYKL